MCCLLTRATNTNKQSVSTGRLQDPVNSGNVRHGVLEQDQIHLRVHFIVLFQSFHEKFVHIRPRCRLIEVYKEQSVRVNIV